MYGRKTPPKPGTENVPGFFMLNSQLKSIKSGYLTATNTVGGLKGDIQNLSYVFDSIGNLESRNTQRTNGTEVSLENMTEQFTYDKLNNFVVIPVIQVMLKLIRFEMSTRFGLQKLAHPTG